MLWDRVTPKPVNQTSLIADVTATDCSFSVLLCDKRTHIQFRLDSSPSDSCDHLSSVCDRLYGAVGLTVVRSLGLRPKDCPCVLCSNLTAR